MYRGSVAVLAMMWACTSAEPEDGLPTDDSGAVDTAELDTGLDTDATAITLQGQITWNVDFDAEAEAAGAADCSYTRQYSGVEDQTAPWLCPECDVVVRADDIVMSMGETDCYPQVTSRSFAPTEWLGWADGVLYRGSGAHRPLRDQGQTTWEGDQLTTLNVPDPLDVPVGGTLQFDIHGALSRGTTNADPLAGWAIPDSYACGWSKTDPPPYEGDFRGVMNQTLPDGWMRDACDEPVRLHDFAGRYLLVTMSALNCPPCRSMAAAEEDFVSEMAALGVAVEVITLMAPSLSDPFAETSKEELQAWVDAYGLHSPVLSDRGFGQAVLTAVRADGGGSYPTTVMVAPDLEVIGVTAGYGVDQETGETTFDRYRDSIITHQGR